MKKAVPYLMIGSTLCLAALAINSMMETPFLTEQNKKRVTLIGAGMGVAGQIMAHVK